ncbi:MAG TPA: signal peptidase II [candidate division WOR-3 bacterium]|uniref:Signal peptidase II n=1 Tax=candidate division WOR-3 bacterium TaxID=2052148 RepID=A0A9C9ELJ6_UNCW3|nr:signal peptidase II [candidate division WOR-3 bacterium]
MNYRIEITPFRVEVCESDSAYSYDDIVVIKSKEGIDLGRVVKEEDEEIEEVYGKIIRKASPQDIEKRNELHEYEEFCLIELKRAVEEFKFAMKPVHAHCQFDEERVIFYFTAQKRLEFRKLHRYISQKLNKRVVIKQIGSRDYSKLFGGIGPCGRNLCCRTFLGELKSISLRMARDQKLYVSPSKISGICGRLLCCLNFEENFYTDFQKEKSESEEKQDESG